MQFPPPPTIKIFICIVKDWRTENSHLRAQADHADHIQMCKHLHSPLEQLGNKMGNWWISSLTKLHIMNSSLQRVAWVPDILYKYTQVDKIVSYRSWYPEVLAIWTLGLPTTLGSYASHPFFTHIDPKICILVPSPPGFKFFSDKIQGKKIKFLNRCDRKAVPEWWNPQLTCIARRSQSKWTVPGG